MLLLAVSDATATTLALLLFGLILAPLLFSVHRTTNRIEADDALDQAEEKATQRSVRIVSKATPELKSAVDLRCAIDSLKTLYDEYKYIVLGELLDAIRADITSCKHGNQATVDAKEKLEALLLSDALPQIEARIRTCKDALAALSDTEGWELVNNKKEMRMFQRWREGNELQVKIEAVLGPDPPVRTADTIIVWREAQLYGRWFPMISSGFKIKEFSHCEVVIHLIAALNFMHCDLLLHGWGVDELRNGFFLMCVRPARQSELPLVELPLHPSKTHRTVLFPPARAIAVIDILVEPLSENSVRFAFQLSQKIPQFLPRWAVQTILHQGMANIFASMQKAALAMATNPKSDHAQLASSPEYRPTAEWLRSKFERFLQQQKVAT